MYIWDSDLVWYIQFLNPMFKIGFLVQINRLNCVGGVLWIQKCFEVEKLVLNVGIKAHWYTKKKFSCSWVKEKPNPKPPNVTLFFYPLIFFVPVYRFFKLGAAEGCQIKVSIPYTLYIVQSPHSKSLFLYSLISIHQTL